MGNRKAILTKNIFLNITVAFLIPLIGYYAALKIAPKKDLIEIFESKEINKISKRIDRKREKKRILKDLEIALSKSENINNKSEEIKEEIRNLKEKIRNLKNLSKEKIENFDRKYLEKNKLLNESIFYIMQILGVLVVLSAIFFPLRPIKFGTILGGLISIAFANLYYWNSFSDLMKIVQLIVIIIFLIILIHKLKLSSKIFKNRR